MNDHTAQIGLQLGQNAAKAGQDYVEQNVRPKGFRHLYGRTLRQGRS